jgi:glucose-fructose oxidoreductase
MKRSTFLTSLGVGLISVTADFELLAKRKKGKLGVALVGLGYYSTDVLGPALLECKHIELKGIVTGSPDKIPYWKEKYGIEDANIYNYDNFDSIKKNKAIDVIYVVLPPSMHKEYTIRAAKAKKHVFCEKPMAPTVADCEEMIAACKKHKVQLAIGYRCQHDPAVQAYRAVTKDKIFGEVVNVVSKAGYVEGREGIWKTNRAMGGGVTADMGVYTIQGARMAVGTEPVAVVNAKMSSQRPELFKNAEETVEFTLEFANGVKAECFSSFGQAVNMLTINYEKGWVKMEPQSGYGGNKGERSDGVKITNGLKSQQPVQMDNDALALKKGEAFLVPGEEGVKDIRIVEAIYKSAGLNGVRVLI